jgi:hypothetical protein
MKIKTNTEGDGVGFLIHDDNSIGIIIPSNQMDELKELPGILLEHEDVLEELDKEEQWKMQCCKFKYYLANRIEDNTFNFTREQIRKYTNNDSTISSKPPVLEEDNWEAERLLNVLDKSFQLLIAHFYTPCIYVYRGLKDIYEHGQPAIDLITYYREECTYYKEELKAAKKEKDELLILRYKNDLVLILENMLKFKLIIEAITEYPKDVFEIMYDPVQASILSRRFGDLLHKPIFIEAIQKLLENVKELDLWITTEIIDDVKKIRL